MATDVFGNPVDFQKQVEAARSNLGGLFPTSPDQLGYTAGHPGRINQLLGTATGEQISDWAQGRNLPSVGMQSPQVSGDDAYAALKQQTNNAGLASSTLDQDIADIRAARAQAEQGIKAQFDIERGREAEMLRGNIGMTEQETRKFGGTGTSGLGASTARQQIIEIEKTASARRMQELTKAETVAKANLAFDEIDRIRSARKDEFDRQERLRQMEFDNRIKLITTGLAVKQEERAGRSEDWQQKYQQGLLDIGILGELRQVPAGETVTIGGKSYIGLKPEEIEPFYKGSDIVDIMQKLPVGQTQTVTDPSTGAVHTITGLAEPDVNTQTFSATDPSGRVTLITIDKKTGKQIAAVDAGQIGMGRAPSGGGTGGLSGVVPGTNQQVTVQDYQQAIARIRSIPTVTQKQIDQAAANGQSLNGMTNEQKQLIIQNIMGEITTTLGQKGLNVLQDIYTPIEGITTAEELSYRYQKTPNGIWSVQEQRILTPDEEAKYKEKLKEFSTTPTLAFPAYTPPKK